jgi:diacylglycerol kinase (ATP)
MSASRQPRPQPSREHPVGPASFSASFVHAWRGIVCVLRTQRNARIHAAVAVAILALALALRLPPAELALLVAMIALVFACEMLNTVVEAIVDLVTAEYHPLAKVAKDVAAGSVLITALGAAVVGLLVVGPHLLAALPR